MTTSGSTNFSQTRDELILKSLSAIGVYGNGRTVSADDMTLCSGVLNMMIKSWAIQSLRLFSKEEAVLYFTPNVSEYYLSNASSAAYCTNKSDEIITQLDGALATSATSVTVDDTTGMAVSDFIGIVLTDKTIHWTTIATLPSSTTLTLASGLASAASDNAYVYTFTNRINRPLRILDGRVIQGLDLGTTSTETSLPITPVAYMDYYNLPSNSIGGAIPNQFLYVPQVANGKLSLWPRPTDGAVRFQFTYERVLEDLDSASDDFDFPQEWYEPLYLQLALRLAPHWGKEDKANKLVLPMATEALRALKEWSTETTSIQMMPDMRDY